MCPICGRERSQLLLAAGMNDEDALSPELFQQLDLGPNLSFDMLFVDDNTPYVLERRVEKSSEDGCTSLLTGGAIHTHTHPDRGEAEGADAPAARAGARSTGEPPCKRLEGEAEQLFQSSRYAERRFTPDSQQQWWGRSAGSGSGSGSGSGCVRRSSSHSGIVCRDGVGWPRERELAPPRSASAQRQVCEATQPITVPHSQSCELPPPWSPVYTDEVTESPLSTSSSSSTGSECADTPPAPAGSDGLMCRHEQQRQTDRFAAFPRAPRDKGSRSRESGRDWSRDYRRRRHSSSNKEPAGGGPSEPVAVERGSGGSGGSGDSDSGNGALPLELADLRALGADDEPLSSTALKGRQLTEDDVILSPRNSLVLADAEFLRDHQQLCARYNERRPPASAAAAAAAAAAAQSDIGAAQSAAAQSRAQQLRRSIANAKRSLRGYEERFQAEYGYRPSQADRQRDPAAQQLLQQLAEARRQLKLVRQETGRTLAVDVGSCSSAGGHQGKENRTPPLSSTATSDSLEEMVAQVTECLAESRESAGRPVSPEAMSRDQVLAEKAALQRALLCLEQRHGRPDQKRDRDLVRPLYERYRLIKRLAVKTGSPKLRESSVGELTPILEHETMTFSSSDRPDIFERQDEAEVASPAATSSAGDQLLQHDDSLHILPLSELRSQLSRAKEDKRRLRQQLLAFEGQFQATMGRRVLKDDRAQLDDQYAEYKQLKAKVKLLEVLVTKRRSRSATM